MTSTQKAPQQNRRIEIVKEYEKRQIAMQKARFGKKKRGFSRKSGAGSANYSGS